MRKVLRITVLCLLPMMSVANWQDWFMNQNQQAHKKLSQGKASQAAQQFRDQNWRAVSHYRAGHYTQAEQSFKANPSLENQYNLGNSFAHQGQYDQAIAAYEAVLKQKPSHKDAAFNLELVKKLKQKQNNQQQKNKQPNQDQQHAENKNKPQKDKQQQADNKKTKSKNNSQSEPKQQAQNKAKPKTSQELEKHASNKQWLNRVQDEPQDLLKQKFLRDYLKRRQGGTHANSITGDYR